MSRVERSQFAAVVVHYGDPHPTLAVAAAVAAMGLRTIVVANDLSARPIGLSPKIDWLVPQRNLGYGGAFNLAVNELPNAEGYFLLNSDLVLTELVVDRCIEIITSRPTVGVCGPRLMHGDKLQHGIGTLAGFGRMPHQDRNDVFRVVDADWVTGAVMLIRGKLARDVPMMEGYFLGCEDVDYCVRARSYGMGTVYVGDVSAEHVGGQAIGARWYYYATRNRLWFGHQNRPRPIVAFLWVWEAILTGRVICADVLKGRGLQRSRFHARAVVDGIRRGPDYGQPAWNTEPVTDSERPGRGGSVSTQLFVAVGNLLILLLGLGSGVVAARWLGPDGRGAYVAATSWAAFLGVVASLGIPQSVVLDAGPARRLARPLIAHVALGLIFLAGVGCLLPINHASHMGVRGIAGFAMMGAGSVAAGAAAGFQQRYGNMRAGFQFVRLGPPLAVVVSMALLILAGNRDPTLWLLASGFAAFLAGVVALMASVGWNSPTPSNWWYERSFVRLSAATFAVAILTQVVYREDILISSVRMAPSAVATYAIAASALGACITAAQAAGMVLFSRLRNARPEDVLGEVRGAVVSAVAGASVVVVPLVLIAPWIVPAVYGNDFEAAVPPVQMLALGGIALAADFALANAILSVGRATDLIWARIAQATLAVPVLLLPQVVDSTTRFAAVRSALYFVEFVSLVCVFWWRRSRSRRPAEEASI